MAEEENKLLSDFKLQVHRFCQEHIEKHIEHDEAEKLFRMDVFNGLGELGLCGVTTEQKYDGLGLSYGFFCEILATTAQYSVSYAVTLSVSTMVQAILSEYGNAQQKQTFLPKLATGQGIGAFALSESQSGSDPAAMETTAKKINGGYQLNGRKMWITSGGIAECYIVLAKSPFDTKDAGKSISAFIVPKNTEGLSFGKPERKMGWRVSPTTELILDQCFIPEENLLGEIGQGFKIALSALDKGRISIGALAVGLSQASLDLAVKYALDRKQFNQSIFDFQGLQFLLAENATELEASRYLVQAAAKAYDQGHSNRKLNSMAKLKATDTAMKLTTDSVQVLGGVGYTEEFPAERYMRDAKVLQIVEGTNQIQKVIIGRELKKQYQK
jgi:acyl-CoA dehydrogenase